MSGTKQPEPEPSGESVLANLIWLQRTREQRLADRRRHQ